MRTPLTIVAAIAFLSISSMALGQETPASKPSDDLLAGPKVEEKAENGPDRMNRDGARQANRQQQIQPQMWMRAVRSLDLTETQQADIRAINEEFVKAQREFEASLTDEEKALVKQARESRASGKTMSEEARKVTLKIEMNRPKLNDYQRRIWDELTPEQQSQLKTKLDAIREQMAQRQREQMQQRRKQDETMQPSPDKQEPVTDSTSAPKKKNADAPRRKRAPAKPGA